MRRVLGTVCALACAIGAWAAGVKTPEESKLFVRHEVPLTGVVSYLLEPGRAAFNQQSLYFTAKSMTDDGRFLVFWASDDEFPPDRRGARVHVPKRLALVDLAKEEIIDLKAGGTIPWIDVKTDQMWYVDAAGVHRRDFLVDPLKDNLLCPWPAALAATKPGTKTARGTHPTLSPDRRYVFLDVRVDNQYRQGVIDTATGAWTEWTQTDFYCNHGQFSPVDPTLALCAWERARFKAPGELYPDERARATFDATGWVSDVLRAPDDVYPRLWLFRVGRNWEVTSKITNYATHEYFAEDGKGFYWCSSGVVYHDLATGRQWRFGPIGMAHATMTADHRDEVAELERLCFSVPWSRNMLAEELDNALSAMLVALDDQGRVAGYAGLQVILDEGYITNVAVRPDCRRQGVAGQILQVFLDFAQAHLNELT